MDPQAHQKTEDIEEDFVTADEVAVIGDYTEDELMEMLREAEESGICEQSFEEIYDELFEKHFGRKPTREERSTDLTGEARF